METFPSHDYPPSYGAEIEADERVLQVQFGDGYVQTALDGINTSLDVYKVTWINATPQKAAFVYGYLRERLKKSPFKFRLPDDLGGEEVIVRCMKISKRFVNWRNYTITAEFKRTYVLGGGL